MKIQRFDYVLPEDRIAAYPLDHRDDARLLCLDRATGSTKHLKFQQIADYLPPRSLLVLNDTRVVPARLRGRRPSGGAVELLLVRRVGSNDEIANSGSPPGSASAGLARPGSSDGDAWETEEWEALARSPRGLAPGTRLSFGPPEPERALVAEVQEHIGGGRIRVSLHPPPGETVAGSVGRVGKMPVPPYILAARRRGRTGSSGPDDPDRTFAEPDHERDLERDHERDLDRYQTVYAAHPGAIAAPTAGLHFTVELLDRIRELGHEIVTLTLHVGPGTFRPVQVEDADDHVMDAEVYTIPSETAFAVDRAMSARRPVVAVGTTVVRALESAARRGDGAAVAAGTASTRLFLRPGDELRVVTDLVTNFHLPRSTLLMLVAAFAGTERVLAAYAEAISLGYRFYSYGDAMLIRGSP